VSISNVVVGLIRLKLCALPIATICSKRSHFRNLSSEGHLGRFVAGAVAGRWSVPRARGPSVAPHGAGGGRLERLPGRGRHLEG